MECLIHSQDILQRHPRLYIVNLSEYIAASRLKYFKISLDLSSNILYCSQVQAMLSIHAASPEGDPASVLFLQFFWFHPRRRNLNRVQSVYSDLDQISYDRFNGAAAVQKYFFTVFFLYLSI